MRVVPLRPAGRGAPGDRPGSRLPVAVVLAFALLAGCSVTDRRMDVFTERYPGVAVPTAILDRKDCRSRLLAAGETLPPDCEPVGDVYIGDTGDSGDCRRERVERDLVGELCFLRADLGVARRLRDTISNCWQVRAVAYRCPSLAAARTEVVGQPGAEPGAATQEAGAAR